jgi:glycosyltransferase involved in cell wall biosynthesis|nr:glycosyltransferase [Desulfobacteraceae bacterium]
LAGGNFSGNPYFQKISNRIRSNDIVLKPDLNYQQLKQLYARGAIFWHACGLNETNPHLIEHFGMTTVEAMQNKCVPVVYDGGGQQEIVSHGLNGFRFKNIDQLQQFTLALIKNKKLREDLVDAAYERSHDFNLKAFQNNIENIFEDIDQELCGVDAL